MVLPKVNPLSGVYCKMKNQYKLINIELKQFDAYLVCGVDFSGG
jgi:hypothetical protein